MLFFKRRTLIYFFSILLVISILAVCYATKEAKEEIIPTVPTIEKSLDNKKIVIDAGHGGFDGGASVGDIVEKDINLNVALKLRTALEECGATITMTRDGDYSTAEADASGHSAKAADLKKRCAITNESGADIFISIHMNKFPQTKYKGAQVFYSAQNEESRMLGEEIQKALPEILQDGNTRVAKKSDGNIYILRKISIPSVIVECGFLSNSEEAENLKKEEYQKELARAITLGVERYFNKE